MDTKPTSDTLTADRARIADLGGPAQVARLLGLDTQRHGTQRVQNWLTRGIPAKVKLDHPELFLWQLPKKAEAA